MMNENERVFEAEIKEATETHEEDVHVMTEANKETVIDKIAGFAKGIYDGTKGFVQRHPTITAFAAGFVAAGFAWQAKLNGMDTPDSSSGIDTIRAIDASDDKPVDIHLERDLTYREAAELVNGRDYGETLRNSGISYVATKK